jgi:hypothetical protein
MNTINKLYQKLIDKNGAVDKKIREKIFQKIFNKVEKLRESQKKFSPETKKYQEIDYKIRLYLLKEIQIIIDELVLAKRDDKLKEWENMYGNPEHYIKDFHYYRITKDYKNIKVLTDYKIV